LSSPETQEIHIVAMNEGFSKTAGEGHGEVTPDVMHREIVKHPPYDDGGAANVVEVLETRVKKDEDPDYGEPSRAIASDGMAS